MAALAGTVALTVGRVVSRVEPVVAAPGETGACPAGVNLLILGGGCLKLVMEGVATVVNWLVNGASAFPAVSLMSELSDSV